METPGDLEHDHASTSSRPVAPVTDGEAPSAGESIPAAGESSSGKRVGGKPNVASACGPCKRAHLACDVNRPCKRCVNMGKEDQCEDVPVSCLSPFIDHMAEAENPTKISVELFHFWYLSGNYLTPFSAQEARSTQGEQGSERNTLPAGQTGYYWR